jgi:hypothetical protein
MKANGRFPPAALYDKYGRPTLSWRVLILPYLGQNALFTEFRLDEAWDSFENSKLLSRMPPVYKVNLRGQKTEETYYQGFQGNGAIFQGKAGTTLGEIMDGTANTLLVVESARGVPWTKPDDLSYSSTEPLPTIGFRRDGFVAAFCDGSIRFIRRSTREATVRALITRDGGETIGSIP